MKKNLRILYFSGPFLLGICQLFYHTGLLRFPWLRIVSLVLYFLFTGLADFLRWGMRGQHAWSIWMGNGILLCLFTLSLLDRERIIPPIVFCIALGVCFPLRLRPELQQYRERKNRDKTDAPASPSGPPRHFAKYALLVFDAAALAALILMAFLFRPAAAENVEVYPFAFLQEADLQSVEISSYETADAQPYLIQDPVTLASISNAFQSLPLYEIGSAPTEEAMPAFSYAFCFRFANNTSVAVDCTQVDQLIYDGRLYCSESPHNLGRFLLLTRAGGPAPDSIFALDESIFCGDIAYSPLHTLTSAYWEENTLNLTFTAEVEPCILEVLWPHLQTRAKGTQHNLIFHNLQTADGFLQDDPRLFWENGTTTLLVDADAYSHYRLERRSQSDGTYMISVHYFAMEQSQSPASQ